MNTTTFKTESTRLAGACTMMYGDNVDFGRTWMRWFLKLTGGLPTS